MVPSITSPRMYQRKPWSFFISLFLHALPFGRLQHLRPSWCELTDQYPIGMRQRKSAQRKEEYSSLIEKRPNSSVIGSAATDNVTRPMELISASVKRSSAIQPVSMLHITHLWRFRSCLMRRL